MYPKTKIIKGINLANFSFTKKKKKGKTSPSIKRKLYWKSVNEVKHSRKISPKDNVQKNKTVIH